MSLRLWVDHPFQRNLEFELAPAAVRHVQVRRLQPGDTLAVFDGRGGEWRAELTSLGRQRARIRLLAPLDALPELAVRVTLALGMPANERMDTLVEKATELGVSCLQPLITQHSVLRLSGERAERRRAHWQAIAGAASEQCGRAWVPQVRPVMPLEAWLDAGVAADVRWLLSPRAEARPLRELVRPVRGSSLIVLSGPEGGLSPAEEGRAMAEGFVAGSLGPRVLRADTAPLAALAWIGLET